MNRLALGFSLLLLLAPAQPGHGAPAGAEDPHASRIRAALARLLQDPDTLEIELSRPVERGDAVRIDSIRVNMAGADFDGLRIDLGRFLFRDLVLDRSELVERTRLVVRSTTEVLVHAEISEGSLNRYVEHKRAKIGVDAPRVRLDRGRMHLSGSFQWKLGRISFGASGDFSVRGDKIHFRPGRFEMNRLAVPKFMIQRVEREINPILDLSALPFRTRVDRIAVEGDRLVITGLPEEARER